MFKITLKPYKKYKDSGVEWLGKIPENWEVRKLKHGVQLISEHVEKKGNDDIFISLERIESWTGKFNLEIGIDEFDSNVKKFQNKDVLFGRLRPYLAKVVLPNTKGVCGGELLVFRPYQIIEPQYLKYLLLNKVIIDLINSSTFGSRMPRASWDYIGQIQVPLFNVWEQQKIANYLNRKTKQADTFIEKQTRIIELLKEQKKAIINQAVTKGLNPDAPMKDSGIEWLGEIPGHWRKGKFSHFVFLRHGYQFRDFDFKSDGIKVIKITQLLANGELELTNTSFVSSNRVNSFKEILIRKNDILMALTGGTIGKIIKVKEVSEPLLQNYRVGAFFPLKKELLKNYLFWILSSDCIFSQITFGQRETGQPNVGKEDFSKMFLTIPPEEEQHQIVTHIETKTAKIDQAIEKAEKEITLVKEYLQSLIYQVVTGRLAID